MKVQHTRYGFVVRLETGEEILATLREFAGREGVRCGEITGLGAVTAVELGLYAPGVGQYVRRRFDDEYELVSLTGNLSDLEGTPFPHLHAVIGARDFTLRGGHLFAGTITVTGELQIVSDPGVLRRVKAPDGGAFNPLEPA